MLYCARETADGYLTPGEMKEALKNLFAELGDLDRVLIIPPDFTRFHSGAGLLTEMAWTLLGDRVKAVLPALGTHFPMSDPEKHKMFGRLPKELVVDHFWREGLTELGRIGGDEMAELSDGRLSYDWPVQINPLLLEDWDLILSIGQVVPHEVVGMANFTKNIVVGTGGKEGIDKSHFLGAVCNMETIMGRGETPVRELFNRGVKRFCRELPIVYVQTVIQSDGDGKPRMSGLYIGDDKECYSRAAALSMKLNIKLLDRAPKKVVVSLDPAEFRSTWLGNKSIYRTRMAIADGGELIVLAPGLRCFGENEDMDLIIRQYGYRGTDAILRAVAGNRDLADNLSVAAHLIHGSSEGRFSIRYCPGALSREEIEGAGFLYGDLKTYSKQYDISALKEGWNRSPEGEEFYYISNPALGLWALEEKFRGGIS